MYSWSTCKHQLVEPGRGSSIRSQLTSISICSIKVLSISICSNRVLFASRYVQGPFQKHGHRTPNVTSSLRLASIMPNSRNNVRRILEPTHLALPPLINRLRLPLPLFLCLLTLSSVMRHQFVQVGLRAGRHVEGGTGVEDPVSIVNTSNSTSLSNAMTPLPSCRVLSLLCTYTST